jgi:AraC-like DNA-binding protein
VHGVEQLQDSHAQHRGDTKNAEIAKYERSVLTQQQLDHIHTELKGVMSTEKLFLTPELTLSMVADRLDVHPNTLSEVINRVEQKSFFDYINTMRIDEFKARVAKPENQNYTLLSIAHDCGFNSKTSFNRNFKNSTGKSPSEYLKEVDINLR